MIEIDHIQLVPLHLQDPQNIPFSPSPIEKGFAGYICLNGSCGRDQIRPLLQKNKESFLKYGLHSCKNYEKVYLP
jgi:hypothetical protein